MLVIVFPGQVLQNIPNGLAVLDSKDRFDLVDGERFVGNEQQ
jgi:hypothetical protein